MIWNTVEQAAFFLVVHLMLPLTETARQRCAQMQSFVFCGFVDRQELENAVLAQNPDLTKQQKETLKKDISELNKLFESCGSARLMVGRMVSIEIQQSYAFLDRNTFTLKRRKIGTNEFSENSKSSS